MLQGIYVLFFFFFGIYVLYVLGEFDREALTSKLQVYIVASDLENTFANTYYCDDLAKNTYPNYGLWQWITVS